MLDLTDLLLSDAETPSPFARDFLGGDENRKKKRKKSRSRSFFTFIKLLSRFRGPASLSRSLARSLSLSCSLSSLLGDSSLSVDPQTSDQLRLPRSREEWRLPRRTKVKIAMLAKT